MMNMTLKKLGYTMKIVSSGSEALNQVTQHCEPYDVILMDTNMEGMSGLECTQRIRQHERQCEQKCTHYVVGQTADVNVYCC